MVTGIVHLDLRLPLLVIAVGYLCLGGSLLATAAPQTLTLRAGSAELALGATGSHGEGVHVWLTDVKPGLAFRQPAPIAIDVVDAQGSDTWLTGGYQTALRQAPGILACTGTLTTAHGTRFEVTDLYQALPTSQAFTLTRRVQIAAPSPRDTGFNSQFSLMPNAPATMADEDFFAPGIWYQDSRYIPPTGLAAHPEDQYFYFREDRLPLPLIAVRDRKTGATLTLGHLGGNPATFAGEDGLNRIVDARMQFGSLGILNTDRPSPTFLFPGTEGERTYTYGGSREKRWAYRSHPVVVGVPHSYRLLIALQRTPSFATEMRDSWRLAYHLQNPPTRTADLALAYRAEMDLLSAVVHPYQGAISVPFQVRVPSGEVIDTSSEMGFVGQALPCATLLLRDGLARGNTNEVARASEVVDFWAQNSTSSAGLQNDWYDIHPDGHVTWRNYLVYLRIESDGMDGALQAWNVLHVHGQDRPGWLAYCRRFGDWLVANQGEDGSWAQSYGLDGHVINPDKDTTIQPVVFLVDLYKATGDSRYRIAALRAGEFAWNTTERDVLYAGGAPDNPNVKDKEAGMCALNSFLALHDLSPDSRWLAAAAQAADYAETWTYCWTIPMPSGDPAQVIPPGRDNLGLSLIAVGQSGCDNFMASAPFLFYRLSLLTGDTHYRDFAEMLLRDTKQRLDLDGSLGYHYPALETEALSLPPLRGHGVHGWLPWLTVCELTPLVSLRETFGAFDIAQIAQQPPAALVRRNAAYARTRGFANPNGINR